MQGVKYIKKKVIREFSEHQEVPVPGLELAIQIRNPHGLRRFFKTAQQRKRQILERMLME